MPLGQSFRHDRTTSSEDAANCLASIIYDFFKPTSIVDVGCATGLFLAAMKRLGVKSVLGIDGSWVPLVMRERFLSNEEFLAHDLETPLNLGKKFDVVVCLEVAEHLVEPSADTLIKSLLKLGEIIVFSAAIPGQDGDGHINCQWPEYWARKFRFNGYGTYDVLRPVLAQEVSVPCWYRQNVVISMRKELAPAGWQSVEIASMVSFECFQSLHVRFTASEQKRARLRSTVIMRLMSKILGLEL